ncbi:hypothetical protein U5M32_05945 [Streptococcus sp. TATVAM-FAB35]|uniref:hypothetical protein n=1 Tax=Streptococcus TaxID=1301 RepID=UPI00397FE065
MSIALLLAACFFFIIFGSFGLFPYEWLNVLAVILLIATFVIVVIVALTMVIYDWINE